MWFYRVILLLTFAYVLRAYKYIAYPQNEEVYEDCPDQPVGVLNVHGLFNMSEVNFKANSEEIYASGNLTAVWDIQPTDRIQGTAEIFVFQRSSWHSTIYSMIEPNVCPLLYEPNYVWHTLWTQYVTNADAIKNECFNPGTKFVHKQHKLKYVLHSPLSNLDGIYKLRLKLKAFNRLNIMRPTSICVDVKGEFFRA